MAKKQTAKSASYLVPALERGLKILELLAENPGGLLMGEMGALDLPSASLYRMLVTLTEMGYVVRDNADRYHLGRKLLTLGYKGLDHAGLPEKSAAPMRALRNAINETVVLGVLSGGEGVVLDTVRSEQAVCVSVRIGHHFPLHTAAPAKAILAFLPEDELESQLKKIVYTKFTDRTLTSRKALLAELKKVRSEGVAYDFGEEVSDLRCVAAPVFDSRSYPVGAIWITGPESRLNEEKLRSMAAQVKATADQIGLNII